MKQPRLKPIESGDAWERIQIDLIDMRSEVYDDYQWIVHVIDHFSKYHIITGHEVTEGLKHNVLPYFGLPKILHWENGLEFCN